MAAKPPRGDAKLKLLPKEQQERIIQWRNSMSHAETLQRIEAELGVEVAPSTLTEFYGWWYLTRELEEAASFADLAKSELEKIPELAANKAKLDEAAQAIFTLRAAKRDDHEAYDALRGIEQRDRALALKEREVAVKEQKFQRDTCDLFLRWAADERARKIAEGAASNETKIAALRQLMFGDLEETAA